MANKSPFPDFDFKWPNFDQGFWDRFSVPGIDSNSLMESQKKNFEALVKANQKAAMGYQNLMRRQGEIMTETMQSIQEAVGDLMKANDGKDLPKKQAELVEKTIGRALKHMKELAELTINANGDAFKVIQDRATESIAEMQQLAEKITAGRK
ncbi:MAG: phasin family protein [Alphaproteobacteria bacterium]|nr:phasin family protein [Alphaproteobacteria bacterium]